MIYDPDTAEKRQDKIERHLDTYIRGIVSARTTRVLLNIAGCSESEIRELIEQADRAKEAVKI